MLFSHPQIVTRSFCYVSRYRENRRMCYSQSPNRLLQHTTLRHVRMHPGQTPTYPKHPRLHRHWIMKTGTHYTSPEEAALVTDPSQNNFQGCDSCVPSSWKATTAIFCWSHQRLHTDENIDIWKSENKFNVIVVCCVIPDNKLKGIYKPHYKNICFLNT